MLVEGSISRELPLVEPAPVGPVGFVDPLQGTTLGERTLTLLKATSRTSHIADDLTPPKIIEYVDIPDNKVEEFKALLSKTHGNSE